MGYFYLATAFVALTAYIAYRSFFDGLHTYPGPFLASLTDAWRMLDSALGAHRPTSLIQLHKQYGDVVRTGPETLSFAQPEAIRDIYGTDKQFTKSDFYWTVAATARGKTTPSLFSSVDGEWHDNLRKAIQPAFNLSALVQYEPFVDSTIRSLLSQLGDRYADRSGGASVVKLQQWMHWYAFDVVGELTYSEPFGFMETAGDVDGIIRKAHFYLTGYFSAEPNPVVRFAMSRQAVRAKGEDTGNGQDRVDLLDKFLSTKAKHPETIGDREVLGLGISMVLAGSESTAVTLSACFYHVLRSVGVYKKLQVEVDQAFPTSVISEAVSFQSSQKLPYLDACIKETFRIHPAARFTPERVLPPQGAMIAGKHVSGGKIVGVNAWVVHRCSRVFGADLEVFRPERWLVADPQDQMRVDLMDRTLFQFGAGRFGCIGKNFSLLEIYKVVPTLLRAFEFRLVEPAREWRFESGSFANVSGVDVIITRRK
ncbi:hypothetical protein LTR78_004922 [Recurvomyces mirabilis]|uniref:Cytochrome P450 n=1 Tax=Recurvomyces mirabilis TaxID=574656 RepID=A0AAE0WPD1_9PEZI|nr:hypothetical protein LTR78_004922 [Recurvomyces mirabilis]KAK5158092.1 hypothetical protein LTS14_004015 [Recurvomyces mirabilis]